MGTLADAVGSTWKLESEQFQLEASRNQSETSRKLGSNLEPIRIQVSNQFQLVPIGTGGAQ